MDYIEQYCHYKSHRMSGKVPIWDIVEMPLNTILLSITQEMGSKIPQLTKNENMQVAQMSLEPTIFNCCQGVLVNMKVQLS
jgi:hypothetical protein